MKIYITSLGVTSAIGLDINTNYISLINGSSGITSIEGLKYLRKPFIGGQVKKRNSELKTALGIEQERKIHRSTLLACMAAREAYQGINRLSNIKTGIIYGTTIGGIDLSDQLKSDAVFDQVHDYRKTYHKGFGTDFLASDLSIKNYKATISTACSTGANAIMLGARLIKAGKLDRVLAGGAEALTSYTINGFDSLMLYDSEPCKPFDENRAGLNLGEGAGFVLLENEKAAAESQKTPLAELIGWANTCDAYHMTGSSPDGRGAANGIKEVLKMSNCSPENIGYINMHGTGTPNNDLSELSGVQSVFKNRLPVFSSTKSYTGHTLAAAGAIEAVYSVLALLNQSVFPSLRVKQPLLGKEQMNKFSITPLTHVLSNSFGFGGNCTELLFAKC